MNSAISTDLRVKLPIFEGPLDLLLYLVKKEELDLYDLPVERVAAQYFEYLQAMRELDLEVAGEFLVVAATLLYLKSRALLPVELQPPAEEGEEEDPRWDLIRQLIEYKKFKDAAQALQEAHQAQEKRHPRGVPANLIRTFAPTSGPAEAGLFDLLAAFQKVLARAQQTAAAHSVEADRWTVADKIAAITQAAALKPRLTFDELFPQEATRGEIVVTFLALLELVRLKKLHVMQVDPSGGIELWARLEEEAPHFDVGMES